MKSNPIGITIISVIGIVFLSGLVHLCLNIVAESEYKDWKAKNKNVQHGRGYVLTENPTDGALVAYNLGTGKPVEILVYFEDKGEIVKVTPTSITTISKSFANRMIFSGEGNKKKFNPLPTGILFILAVTQFFWLTYRHRKKNHT